MTIHPLVLRWLMAGAVFTATVLSAGCSGSRAPARAATRPIAATPAVQPPTAPAVPAVPVATPREAPARVVNAFGEFDSIPRKPTAPPGQSGLEQHTTCEEGYDADVAVDPTGKFIIFSSTRHSEHPDIYLQRVDGASVMQLTTDPADDVQPTFSPDGKRLAFCSNRAGVWDIYLMDLDGRNVEQVTNGPAQKMHPSFSPDGSRLVYCALSPRSDQWELWMVSLNSHERRMIGNGLFPSWSPRKDVDRIAFQRARQRGSRWFSLWTVDLVDGEPRRLTEVAASSNAAVIWPVWSPDGSRLAFATVISPSAEKSQQRDIWTVAADGTGRHRLTQGDAANFSPFWSVDNRVYFVSDRGGHESIWSVQADATGTTAVAAGEPGPGTAKGQSGRVARPAMDAKAGAAAAGAIGSADAREVAH